MGHVESGGEVAGPEASGLKTAAGLFRSRPFWKARTAPHPVWDLWWGLKKEFSILGAPASWLTTPGSWGYFGNDFVSGLRRNRSTLRSFALLDAAPDQFEGTTALAALNAARHQQMFQLVALGYISIPVTIVLGLAEVMPDSLIATFRDHHELVLNLVAMLTIGAAIYMIGLWRARQLVAVLELWRLERGLPPGGVRPAPAPRREPRPKARAKATSQGT
ncbi:hypothetical protein [Brevundimonas lenta]|uniref:Uncharacterized protein n=1 Tax=Brevundimonas lenta TaxID=424796 RepID=A0A7W6NPJ7_9CAUL|nr:hypothetical protein [Brevundimonas lenta]MBB4082968.1 hypothetical protein [Brevundimonas lenta]